MFYSFNLYRIFLKNFYTGKLGNKLTATRKYQHRIVMVKGKHKKRMKRG